MKRKISFRQYLCLILNQPQRQRPAQVWPGNAVDLWEGVDLATGDDWAVFAHYVNERPAFEVIVAEAMNHLPFSFRIHLEALTCKRTDTFWPVYGRRISPVKVKPFRVTFPHLLESS